MIAISSRIKAFILKLSRPFHAFYFNTLPKLMALRNPFQVMSTKLLNKKPNKKLKSVTIIHSATTETVRLPEDNNGVIVHTAVRTKVPLKKKVRGERKKKPPEKKSSKTAAATTTTTAATHPDKAAADRKEATHSAVVRPKRTKKSGVRGGQQQQKKVLSLYKSSRGNKKEIIDYSKRLGASEKSDLSAIGKVQKWLLESPANAGNDGENSSIISGDVLQQSNNEENVALKKSVSTPDRLMTASGGGGAAVKKKNTLPATKPTYHNPAPPQTEKVKLQVVYKPPFKFSLKLKKRNPVSTTVTSPYRVKKAGAPNNGGGGGGKKAGHRSGGGGEKNRIGIMSSSSQDKSTILRKNRLALLIRSENDSAGTAAEPSTSRATLGGGSGGGAAAAIDDFPLPGSSSAGLLLVDNHRKGDIHYENVHVDQKPINTATFRIKKSSSSGNASQLDRGGGGRMDAPERRQRTGSSTMKSNNSKDSSIGADTTMTSDRSRDISVNSGSRHVFNSNNNNTTNSGSIERSLRHQLGGSSGNLVLRSSTTNLAKLNGGNSSSFHKDERLRNSLNMQRQLSSPADTFKRTSDSNSNVLLGRNATATSIQNNLQNGNMIMFKKLSSSNTNLAKFSDEFLAKRASNSSLNNVGVSRRPSVSSDTPTKRRSSINSHRHSASGSRGQSGSFDRRASMGSHNTRKSKGSHTSAAPPTSSSRNTNGTASNERRPHTAACDMIERGAFEWPPPPPDYVTKKLDEPLPSDMEVLCSDVEHTFQDR